MTINKAAVGGTLPFGSPLPLSYIVRKSGNVHGEAPHPQRRAVHPLRFKTSVVARQPGARD
jgi:hypothetical protein